MDALERLEGELEGVLVSYKYSANYGILTLDKRSRGDKVFWQEVQKAINRKAAKIGILGVPQGYPGSCQCSIAASNLNSGKSLEKISYI